MGDMEKLLDKKQLFLKGLEELSKFRSVMAFSSDPELKELQKIFDQGFTVLRDQFQQAMDEKAANVTTGSIKSRLKKVAAGTGTDQLSSIKGLDSFVTIIKKAIHAEDDISLDEAKKDSLLAITNMKKRTNEWSIRDTLCQFTTWGFWNGGQMADLDTKTAIEVADALYNYAKSIRSTNEEDIFKIYDKVSHYL